jgi:hypothetical protein
VVQVENEELLYSTGTGHFAGFFSTSGILRPNVAGATDTTVLDTIEQAIDAIERAIEQMRSGPSGQLKILWCVADVWHPALGERPVCHSCGSPVDDSDAHAEYKQVTVLFADVVHSMDIASVVGAERLREIMVALIDRAAVVVQRSEGRVGEFTGDRIMVVLGGRP